MSVNNLFNKNYVLLTSEKLTDFVEWVEKLNIDFEENGIEQGCSNVFNSGPNFTFAYIYWAITKKATSGSACCETRMWLADRGEQS